MERVQAIERPDAADDEMVLRQHKLRRFLSRLLRREAADLEVHQQDILNARLADHYRLFPPPWRPDESTTA